MAGGVAQGIGPQFKSQYHKKEHYGLQALIRKKCHVPVMSQCLIIPGFSDFPSSRM
jgi:hypothetical protein